MPVIVTFVVPTTAAVVALNVTVLAEMALAGLKLAVTPAGKLLALKETVPANPPEGVTLMTLGALPPCATEVAGAEIVKLPRMFTVKARVVV